jgi:hypothetical protein
MRVQQHIDDVATAEVAGEMPSPVTWDPGQFTGLSPSPGPFAQTRRGYRDAGPPALASALQLICNGAGFYIDPRTFSHQLPLVLVGLSASTARDHSTPAAVSRLSGFGQYPPCNTSPLADVGIGLCRQERRLGRSRTHRAAKH